MTARHSLAESAPGYPTGVVRGSRCAFALLLRALIDAGGVDESNHDTPCRKRDRQSDSEQGEVIQLGHR